MKKTFLIVVAFIGSYAQAQTNDSIPEISNKEFEYLGKTETDTVVKYGTTTQAVIRFGVNNLRTENQFTHSDFRYLGSSTFEIGLTARKPFSKDDNLLGLRYGVMFSYNMLSPTDNRVFGIEGNQTNLQVSDKNLRKPSTYFKNSYVQIPITLDFDFSKKEYNHANRKFVWNEGLNFGIGGYVGYNINSKQFISYKDEFGNKVTEKHHGKWNVEDFNYGLMAYVGNRNYKLYAKYDLSPVFKNNAKDQYFWTLGIQLDLGN